MPRKRRYTVRRRRPISSYKSRRGNTLRASYSRGKRTGIFRMGIFPRGVWPWRAKWRKPKNR